MLEHRRIRLDWPDDTRAAWQPTKPEFAAAVNALSLGMPSGEPYVMQAVRRAAAGLDDPILTARVKAYLAQEGEHTRQHRRFNEIITAQHPALRHVERWLEMSYRALDRWFGPKFATAYAVGFEATAFAAARWMDAHRHELFRGADPEPATLVLWHLAEEVEHKSVAHDVWAATDGNRLRYVTAMATCFAMLVWFIFLGTVVQLTAWRRVLSPIAWFRLWKWGIGFAFEVMPTMAITALPSHHPNHQADPSWMPTWLAAYDPETATMPAWDAPIEAYLDRSPDRRLTTV
ncbi:MAG: metal-dependent hydrolase [Acidimicrobiales bacterium]